MTDPELAQALEALALKTAMWKAKARVSDHGGVTYATVCGYVRATNAPDVHTLHVAAKTMLAQVRERYELLIVRG